MLLQDNLIYLMLYFEWIPL